MVSRRASRSGATSGSLVITGADPAFRRRLLQGLEAANDGRRITEIPADQDVQTRAAALQPAAAELLSPGLARRAEWTLAVRLTGGAELLAADLDADGVLDTNHQTAQISLTGSNTDDTEFIGGDELDLFLSGKALRELLDQLAAQGEL